MWSILLREPLMPKCVHDCSHAKKASKVEGSIRSSLSNNSRKNQAQALSGSACRGRNAEETSKLRVRFQSPSQSDQTCGDEIQGLQSLATTEAVLQINVSLPMHA
jgi:hypothetical protein